MRGRSILESRSNCLKPDQLYVGRWPRRLSHFTETVTETTSGTTTWCSCTVTTTTWHMQRHGVCDKDRCLEAGWPDASRITSGSKGGLVAGWATARRPYFSRRIIVGC